MNAPTNQAYREAFERFLTRLGWQTSETVEYGANWTNGEHDLKVPNRDHFDEFDEFTWAVKVFQTTGLTGATFTYEVADLFPRWEIRRKDDGLMCGEYQWLDAGTDTEPDWASVDEDEGSEPAEFIAVQVSAIQTRQHPRTQGTQP